MNLSNRILLLTLGILAGVGLLVGGYTVFLSDQLIRTAHGRRIEDLSAMVAALVRPDLYELRVDRINRTLENLFSDRQIAFLRIYDPNGLLLADGHQYPSIAAFREEAPQVQESLLRGQPGTWHDRHLRTRLEVIRDALDQPMGYAVVGLNCQLEHYHQARQRYEIFLVVGSLLVGGGWIAAYLAGTVVAPLRRLTGVIQRGDETFAAELHEVCQRQDEFGQLARTYCEAEALRRRQHEELRASSEALQRAKAASDEAARTKSEFLANMSHEIRTPLNGLLGLNEILLERDPRPEQAELLRIARASGESLLTILNDILDFSKIEAGALELDPEPTDLVALVRNSIALFERRLEEKALAHVVEVPPSFPRLLLLDPQRVRQVVDNLLSNAIKFTDRGSIAVRLEFQSSGPSTGHLRLAVCDTGIGISPEKQERIFERFAQADSSTTRRYGGTGLGLAICQRLVERMDGTLSLVSQPGDGSTFTVELPALVCRPEPALGRTSRSEATARPEPLPPVGILLVEDNPINIVVAELILDRIGQKPVVARNGPEALARAREQAFDLVLMDIHMPGMSGLETTRALRSDPGVLGRPRVYALTAEIRDQEHDECLRAGMAGVLSKPLDSASLADVVRHILAERPLDDPARADALAATPRSDRGTFDQS